MVLTNAPRPAAEVKQQLDRMGVPQHAYDSIVTSGDLTRAWSRRPLVKPFFTSGPKRDLPLFAGLGRSLRAERDGGLHCLHRAVSTTRTRRRKIIFRRLRRHSRASMFLLCANPDIVVGARHTADLLRGCVGRTLSCDGRRGGLHGKPHPAIYQEALKRAAAARGVDTPLDRVVAIGDSIRTDMKGASEFRHRQHFCDGRHSRRGVR